MSDSQLDKLLEKSKGKNLTPKDMKALVEVEGSLIERKGRSYFFFALYGFAIFLLILLSVVLARYVYFISGNEEKISATLNILYNAGIFGGLGALITLSVNKKK